MKYFICIYLLLFFGNVQCQIVDKPTWQLGVEMTSLFEKENSINLHAGYKKSNNIFYLGLSNIHLENWKLLPIQNSNYIKNSGVLFSILNKDGSVQQLSTKEKKINLTAELGFRKIFTNRKFSPVLGGGFSFAAHKSITNGDLPDLELIQHLIPYPIYYTSSRSVGGFLEFGIDYRLNKKISILLRNSFQLIYSENISSASDLSSYNLIVLSRAQAYASQNFSFNTNTLDLIVFYNFK